MQTKVNFGFISGLEGGRSLTAYVPDAANSKSGVTVASGFDIGQRSYYDLSSMFPHELAIRLQPYAKLTGQKAVDALALLPLVLDEDEAELVDKYAKCEAINLLRNRYNAASDVAFETLPEQAQTVIASVAFQYGDLASRCPRFWGCAVKQNWAAMAEELRDFGDRYPTRHRREATYLTTMGNN